MQDNLVRTVQEIIGSAQVDESTFWEVALEIARFQGNLEESRPSRASKRPWELVRPVPEGAFKLMTVAHFPPSEAQAEFRTSGTTRGQSGRHLIRDLELYRQSVLRGFQLFCMYEPPPTVFLSLIPTAQQRPHSSLSHMVTFVGQEFGLNGFFVARRGDHLDWRVASQAFERALDLGTPCMVLGTTLDFVPFLQALEKAGRVALPKGSRVMHTGGDKGRDYVLAREELLRGLWEGLAIRAEDVIEEYGMTELLSQAYVSPRMVAGPRRFVTVPWMRTRVVDPATLEDVRKGVEGLMIHYDLANVYTSVAVMTYDIAPRVANGFGRVRRAPYGGLRGCSSDAAR